MQFGTSVLAAESQRVALVFGHRLVLGTRFAQLGVELVEHLGRGVTYPRSEIITTTD